MDEQRLRPLLLQLRMQDRRFVLSVPEHSMPLSWLSRMKKIIFFKFLFNDWEIHADIHLWVVGMPRTVSAATFWHSCFIKAWPSFLVFTTCTRESISSVRDSSYFLGRLLLMKLAIGSPSSVSICTTQLLLNSLITYGPGPLILSFHLCFLSVYRSTRSRSLNLPIFKCFSCQSFLSTLLSIDAHDY